MSPELLNLAISLGVFALLAIVWRYWFATSTFPGAAVAPAMAARGDAAKPRNLIEIRSEAQFMEIINSGPACFCDWTATWSGAAACCATRTAISDSLFVCCVATQVRPVPVYRAHV